MNTQRKETLSRRERVRRAIEHKPVDRMPIDLGCHYSTGISAFAYFNLRKYLGFSTDNVEIVDPGQFLARVDGDVLDRFHLDAIVLHPGYPQTRRWNPRGDYDFIVPAAFRPRLQPNGAYHIYSDEHPERRSIMPKNGFFFDGDALRYESGAGSFERVETERFDSTLDVQGEQVRVMFDYAVRGGVAAIANVEPGQAAAWEPLSVFGDPAALGVVCIVGGRRCPVLLDLDTGEYVDILGGLDVDTFDFDTGAASERGMLYRVSGSWVWYDAELGESVDLRCFSGEHVDFCALAGDAIACWSYRGGGPDMTVHVWSIDIATLERTDILYDTPAKDIVLCPAEGFDTPGAAFALLLDDGNVVSILDLESGERRSISGPAIPAADCCAYASPDGTRMLICEAGDEGYYGNIAVIDSVSGTFEVIERENTSNVYEKHCYWYDAGAVAVTGRDRDTGEDVCYVYSFD